MYKMHSGSGIPVTLKCVMSHEMPVTLKIQQIATTDNHLTQLSILLCCIRTFVLVCIPGRELFAKLIFLSASVTSNRKDCCIER